LIDSRDFLAAKKRAEWASHGNIPPVATLKPGWTKHAKAAPFKRNDALLELTYDSISAHCHL
jgi:hypothetical protein